MSNFRASNFSCRFVCRPSPTRSWPAWRRRWTLPRPATLAGDCRPSVSPVAWRSRSPPGHVRRARAESEARECVHGPAEGAAAAGRQAGGGAAGGQCQGGQGADLALINRAEKNVCRLLNAAGLSMIKTIAAPNRPESNSHYSVKLLLQRRAIKPTQLRLPRAAAAGVPASPCHRLHSW